MLNTLYPEERTAELKIETLAELVILGLEQNIANKLSALISDAITEIDVVVGLLMALSKSKHGKDLSRHASRIIRMAGKKVVLDSSVGW